MFESKKEDITRVLVEHFELDEYRETNNVFNFTPQMFAKHMFESKKKDITRVLVEHFELTDKSNDCDVTFLQRSDAMVSASSSSAKSSPVSLQAGDSGVELV